MECGLYIPSVPFVVLTVNLFVGRGGGSLERQKQDSHVFEKLLILPHRRSTTVSLETYRRDFCEAALLMCALITLRPTCVTRTVTCSKNTLCNCRRMPIEIRCYHLGYSW